jgi:hypothetical protein
LAADLRLHFLGDLECGGIDVRRSPAPHLAMRFQARISPQGSLENPWQIKRQGKVGADRDSP